MKRYYPNIISTCLVSVNFLFSFYSNPASAQSRSCKDIQEDKARLACYDKPDPLLETPKTGSWYKQEEVSDLDKSKTVSISLNAEKSSLAKYPNDYQFARLVINCVEKKTRLYVVFKGNVAYGIRGFTAQYRAGNSPPSAARWSVSQDRTAYGPFASPATVPLIKQIMASDDFFVRGEDEVAGTSEAYFKVVGLQEAIKPVREGCKW